MTTCPPLLVKLLDPDARPPERAHAADAGLDLYLPRAVTVPRGRLLKVGLGVAVAVPAGRVGLIKDRSGLAAAGLHVLGGVIDPGYTGELMVVVKNLAVRDITLERHARVAQLLVVPVDRPGVDLVDELPASDRGAGGFGSTGG